MPTTNIYINFIFYIISFSFVFICWQPKKKLECGGCDCLFIFLFRFIGIISYISSRVENKHIFINLKHTNTQQQQQQHYY